MTYHHREIEAQPDPLPTGFADLALPARLSALRDAVEGRIVFTTSFGLEDQALTHAIAEAGVRIEFATLDTGRLFDETLELWAETELRYGVHIAGFAPDRAATEALVRRDGPLGFRNSVANRTACCGVRKVEPLGRALAGASGWLTGLRANQSATRSQTAFASPDPDHGLMKLSPLADWSREAVRLYVERTGAPYNPLHDRGFPSIGCAPCTRAVLPGEPERAGRWWWEAEAKKECGLHLPAQVPTGALLAALS